MFLFSYVLSNVDIYRVSVLVSHCLPIINMLMSRLVETCRSMVCRFSPPACTYTDGTDSLLVMEPGSDWVFCLRQGYVSVCVCV